MKKLNKLMLAFVALTISITALAPSMAFADTLQEKDQDLKENYENAKNKYQNENDFIRQARENYLQTKKVFEAYKNADNKKALEDAARKYIELIIQRMSRRLETIKTWANNRESLGDAEKQAIATEVNNDVAWLNTQLEKIPTATGEEIKSIINTIRGYWLIHASDLKKLIGQVESARVESAITKSQNFSDTVSSSIDKLKDEGKDTTQLEAWLDTYDKNIALAQDSYEKAQEKYKEIETGAEFDAMFKNFTAYLRGAQKYLIEAHNQLVQIVQELRNQGVK